MKRNNKTPKGPRIPKGPQADLTKPSRPPGSFPSWSKETHTKDLQDIHPLPPGQRIPKVAHTPVPFSGGHAEYLPDSVARGRLTEEPQAPKVVIPTRPLENPEATRDAVLEFIAQGGDMKAFTDTPGAPTMAQLAKLFSESESAQAALTSALAIKADIRFDEIVKIADSDIEINRAKLMVEARKYVVERLNQKKYSLKHEITGELGLTINVKRFGEDRQWQKEAS